MKQYWCIFKKNEKGYLDFICRVVSKHDGERLLEYLSNEFVLMKD